MKLARASDAGSILIREIREIRGREMGLKQQYKKDKDYDKET